MDWAVDAQSWYDAFKISGSFLLTLVFALVDNFPPTVLAFSETIKGEQYEMALLSFAFTVLL